MDDLLEKSGKLPENRFVVFSYFTEILKCQLSSCRMMGVQPLFSALLSPPPIFLRHLFIDVHKTVVDLYGATGQPQGFRISDVSNSLPPHELPDPVQTFDVVIIEARG